MSGILRGSLAPAILSSLIMHGACVGSPEVPAGPSGAGLDVVQEVGVPEIAFSSNRSGNFEIHIMNTDGTGVVQLTDDPRGDFRPAWSPDGSRIAWSRQSATNPSDFTLWVMNANGSGQHELNPVHGGCPAWAPDGTRIAFWSGPFYGDVMVINADGTNLQNLSNSPLNYEGCPAWSPDGSLLVFPEQYKGPGWQIDLYTMRPDGSQPTLLLAEPGAQAFPAWSPDGSRILFSHNSGAGPGLGGQDGLFVVNPDGTGLERLANFGGVEGIADWSLDGTRIVYMGFAADWDIYVMNADGSGVTQLTRNHQVVDWQPNWR